MSLNANLEAEFVRHNSVLGRQKWILCSRKLFAGQSFNSKFKPQFSQETQHIYIEVKSHQRDNEMCCDIIVLHSWRLFQDCPLNRESKCRFFENKARARYIYIYRHMHIRCLAAALDFLTKIRDSQERNRTSNCARRSIPSSNQESAVRVMWIVPLTTCSKIIWWYQAAAEQQCRYSLLDTAWNKPVLFASDLCYAIVLQLAPKGQLSLSDGDTR